MLMGMFMEILTVLMKLVALLSLFSKPTMMNGCVDGIIDHVQELVYFVVISDHIDGITDSKRGIFDLVILVMVHIGECLIIVCLISTLGMKLLTILAWPLASSIFSHQPNPTSLNTCMTLAVSCSSEVCCALGAARHD